MKKIISCISLAFGMLLPSIAPAQIVNPAFIQSGGGAAARAVTDKARESVSVLDFYANGVSGARVDKTGVTDSTGGIQAAINSLSAGGVVHFPSGTYKFSGITLPDVGGITLVGDGPGASVLSYSGSGTAIAKADQMTAKSHDRVESLSLVNAGTGTVGIDISALWQSSIKNLYISGFTTGIYGQSGTVGTYWNRIERNAIDGATNGIWFANASGAGPVNQNWIVNNRIYNPSTVGIKIEALCMGNVVSGNDIESTGALSNFIAVAGSKSVIRENWLDSTNSGNTGVLDTGTRNLLMANVYAGTFGTPYNISGAFFPETYQPDRGTADSWLNWNFKASNNNFSNGLTASSISSDNSVTTVPTGVATTVYTLASASTQVGILIAYADSVSANVYAIAYAGIANTNPSLSVLSSNALTMTLSGDNIQVEHTLGSNRNIRVMFLRLQ